MRGLVTFVVTIGDQIYNCNASDVPNLAYCLVFGHDFLHKNGVVINAPNEKVTLALTLALPDYDHRFTKKRWPCIFF